jgi:hypothetical protein
MSRARAVKWNRAGEVRGAGEHIPQTRPQRRPAIPARKEQQFAGNKASREVFAKARAGGRWHEVRSAMARARIGSTLSDGQFSHGEGSSTWVF